MLPEDPWNSWWIKALAYGLFAMFGGMMGHLMRTIDSRQKIKWSRAALEGGAAGFVGLLMLLVCMGRQQVSGSAGRSASGCVASLRDMHRHT